MLAFIVGVGVAAVNYSLSKFMLKKHPDMYAGGQIVRQIIQIGYLVLLFTLGGYTPWDPVWLLLGGCLGITVPMFFFTYKLVKQNDNMNKREEDKKDG